MPGFESVYLLREPEQANMIACASSVMKYTTTNCNLFLLSLFFLQGKRVVIIGTSFIGMEVASYLSDKAASVECIDIASVPFERVLGDRIGKMLQNVKAT